jgi:hypothetical protein
MVFVASHLFPDMRDTLGVTFHCFPRTEPAFLRFSLQYGALTPLLVTFTEKTGEEGKDLYR